MKLKLLFLLLLPLSLHAADTDTLSLSTSPDSVAIHFSTILAETTNTEKEKWPIRHENERFRPKQLIAPGLLVGVGAWGISHRWAVKQKRRLDDKLMEWNGGKKKKFDDYLQYLPVVSYVGLGFTGAKSKHGLTDRVFVTATSYIALAVLTNVTKYFVDERRPDSPATNSFPSGHTATAFMGAELVRRDYGPVYGTAAYAVATTVAFMRLYNHRHWLNDVLAGAGVGILSANIGYWLMPLHRRLFKTDKWGHGRKYRPALAVLPTYDPISRGFGGALCMQF